MSKDLETRFAHHEAAMIALLERVSVLERSLAFEVSQREAMEQIITTMAGLPRRMTRVETELRSARHRCRSS